MNRRAFISRLLAATAIYAIPVETLEKLIPTDREVFTEEDYRLTWDQVVGIVLKDVKPALIAAVMAPNPVFEALCVRQKCENTF